MKPHEYKVLAVVVAFVGIIGCVVTVATFIILSQHQSAIDDAHRTEYRLCARQMVNRAVMNADRDRDERPLPVYDCTPNLKGRPARRLTPAETEKFRRYVLTTPTNQLP